MLSSAAAIREALARRWGDFVGRPHSYLGMGELQGLGAPMRVWGESEGGPCESSRVVLWVL